MPLRMRTGRTECIFKRLLEPFGRKAFGKSWAESSNGIAIKRPKTIINIIKILINKQKKIQK